MYVTCDIALVIVVNVTMETYKSTPILWTVTPADSGSWCWHNLRYLSQFLRSLQVINEGVEECFSLNVSLLHPIYASEYNLTPYVIMADSSA